MGKKPECSKWSIRKLWRFASRSHLRQNNAMRIAGGQMPKVAMVDTFSRQIIAWQGGQLNSVPLGPHRAQVRQQVLVAQLALPNSKLNLKQDLKQETVLWRPSK